MNDKNEAYQRAPNGNISREESKSE